jgi:hypothetical protein
MLKYPANNIEIYSNADMRMNGAHGLINFAYRDTSTERDNVMGGSSVYFSSMPEDSSVSNLFSNECENFIYNAIDNLFIVSMTDKDGNEIYIMPNITFRD